MRLAPILFSAWLCGPAACIAADSAPGAPASAAGAEIIYVEGKPYQIRNGDLYALDAKSGQPTFVQKVFDPDYVRKTYAQVDGKLCLKDPSSGRAYPVLRRLKEDFEGAGKLTDLIGVQRGWNSCTLQSPQAPEVADYVRLRQRLFKGQGEFLDNRVEPSTEQAHGGKSALRCYSVPPTPKMVTAKASLDTELLYFAHGDSYWFSGWFFLKEGCPTTLMDLECGWAEGGPGMRILVEDDHSLSFELKWAHKPKYRQPRGQRTPLPAGRWVKVTTHLQLSEKPDGLIELWQDGKKLLSEKGQTFPLAGLVYDRLELGITANPHGTTTVLFVDDVEVSDQPLAP